MSSLSGGDATAARTLRSDALLAWRTEKDARTALRARQEELSIDDTLMALLEAKTTFDDAVACLAEQRSGACTFPLKQEVVTAFVSDMYKCKAHAQRRPAAQHARALRRAARRGRCGAGCRWWAAGATFCVYARRRTRPAARAAHHTGRSALRVHAC